MKRIIPHITIVLSLMTLTFFVIDRFNEVMAFMTSELSKWVFALLAVTGFATAVLLIGMQWSEDDRKARRALKQKTQTSAVESTESANDEPKDA